MWKSPQPSFTKVGLFVLDSLDGVSIARSKRGYSLPKYNISSKSPLLTKGDWGDFIPGKPDLVTFRQLWIGRDNSADPPLSFAALRIEDLSRKWRCQVTTLVV